MVENIEVALSNILVNEISDFNFSKVYKDIYKNYDDKLKNIFSYLHQNLNELINFMNDKSKSNGHYNAHESRMMIFLIETIEELQLMLKNKTLNFKLNEDYEKHLRYCETFLVSSNGSPIPSDYKRFTIVKYDPVFTMSNNVVISSNTSNTNFEKKLIGTGAYANVHMYKDEFYNEIYALKKLKNDVDGKERRRFKNEFAIMNKIKHPYILKVYCYNEKDNSYVMEYCSHTLKKYLDSNNNKSEFNFAKRRNLVIQFLIAINYLHSKRIYHRDISYNNVLIKEYDDNLAMLRISDFGLVKDLNLELTRTESEIRGTLIDDTLKSFKDYNIKNEIYSVGMIIYFIFTGRTNLKFEEDDISKIIAKCVDRDIEKRYNNVSEIIVDIKKVELVNSDLTSKNEKQPISDKALRILFNAIEKGGFIYTENNNYGEMICGNLKIKLFDIPIREKTEWISAFEELEKDGYIIGNENNSSFYSDDFDNDYEVTKKGFEYYDDKKKV